MIIDARGGKYGTALQVAYAHSRNNQVIRFLLSHADPGIELKESKYGTALQAVCTESHDNGKVVMMLLGSGAKKPHRTANMKVSSTQSATEEMKRSCEFCSAIGTLKEVLP